MFRQFDAARPQWLCSVDDGMHHHILCLRKASDAGPGCNLPFRENAAIVHHPLKTIVNVFIDEIGDIHIHGPAIQQMLLHGLDQSFQRCLTEPVIRIHDLEVKSLCMTDALVHAFSMPAILLMNHPDDVRILLCIVIRDHPGIIC